MKKHPSPAEMAEFERFARSATGAKKPMKKSMPNQAPKQAPKQMPDAFRKQIGRFDRGG